MVIVGVLSPLLGCTIQASSRSLVRGLMGPRERFPSYLSVSLGWKTRSQDRGRPTSRPTRPPLGTLPLPPPADKHVVEGPSMEKSSSKRHPSRNPPRGRRNNSSAPEPTPTDSVPGELYLCPIYDEHDEERVLNDLNILGGESSAAAVDKKIAHLCAHDTSRFGKPVRSQSKARTRRKATTTTDPSHAATTDIRPSTPKRQKRNHNKGFDLEYFRARGLFPVHFAQPSK